jgi:N-acetylglucosaminyl-diphospho-decaprenol L-rhamnosyltransferase
MPDRNPLSPPSLRVIIVNWNAGEQLRECLRSLATACLEGFRIEQVVVVDNASQDGSVDNLEAEFDTRTPVVPLCVLRNAGNRGFAAACNQGVEGSSADYLLFLNPDTRVFSDTLAESVAFLQKAENRQIGILGVKLLEEEGAVSRGCARFPSPRSLIARSLGWDRLFPGAFPGHYLQEWDHETSREVDQVMGAYFLVRHALFNTLSGFDERFFVYYEDLDFALRARQAGWTTYYWVGAAVYHRGNGTTDQVKAKRLCYSLFSRIRYCQKHFSPGQARAVTAVILLGEPWTRLTLDVCKGSLSRIRDTAGGFVLLWHALRRGSVGPLSPLDPPPATRDTGGAGMI